MNDKSWKISDFNMCSVAGNVCMMPTNTLDFAKQSSMNYSYGADVGNGFGSEVGADVGFAVGSDFRSDVGDDVSCRRRSRKDGTKAKVCRRC